MRDQTYPSELAQWATELNDETYGTSLNEVVLADIDMLIRLDDEIRELKRKKEVLEDEIRRKSETRKTYEESLLEVWTDAGTTQVKQDGRTISLRTDRWPRLKDEFKPQAADLFIRSGLGYMLSVNSMLLRSYVLNHVDHGEPLPDELTDKIEINEVFSLRTTPSKRSRE